jgi:hypothetical protein
LTRHGSNHRLKTHTLLAAWLVLSLLCAPFITAIHGVSHARLADTGSFNDASRGSPPHHAHEAVDHADGHVDCDDHAVAGHGHLASDLGHAHHNHHAHDHSLFGHAAGSAECAWWALALQQAAAAGEAAGAHTATPPSHVLAMFAPRVQSRSELRAFDARGPPLT